MRDVQGRMAKAAKDLTRKVRHRLNLKTNKAITVELDTSMRDVVSSFL
jgi:hypothetical protein